MMIKQLIQDSIDTKISLLKDDNIINTINECVDKITDTFQKGNKVLFCGNGGSAADAQHLAAEFSGRFYIDRKALPSEALHTNTSYLTAVANDYSYDVVYSRLIEGTGNAGDVLIGLSTSGNSKNIINAIQTANKKNITTVGFTGEKGGKMNAICDYIIKIPSTNTPRIQECHMLIGHIICELVEKQIFKKQYIKES